MRRAAVWLAGIAVVATAGTVFAGPDNVVFPPDYRDTMQVVAVRDHHLGGNSIAVIYANQIAIDSARLGGDLASGALFVMEVWSARTENEQLVRDADGRLVQNELRVINMMEKRDGWRAEYPVEWRNGNWEFASYTGAGELRDANYQSCFECHKPVGDAGYDFAYVVGAMR